MQFDFTSRLQPVRNYVPPVLYDIIVDYVGNELLPRKIIRLRPDILCIGNDRVYWMNGFDIMCEDRCLIHCFFCKPKRSQYVNDKWLILDHAAVNLQTRTWRMLNEDFNEDFNVKVHNGKVYLSSDYKVEIFDLDSWKGVPIYQMGPKVFHLSVLGDCVTIGMPNCKTFLVDDNTIMKTFMAVVYKWNDKIFKIGLFDLVLEETKLFHFPSMITPVAYKNVIFFQCSSGESFVYDIDTNTMAQIEGNIRYRNVNNSLYSVSDHVYLY